MRALYTLFWLAALPFAFVYLAWRALRQPDYLRHWHERLGYAPVPPAGCPVIWVHAVSVGETRASEPLVRALLRDHPGAYILLTHSTPTGRAAGEAIFGGAVARAYLPYDLPWLLRRFLRRARPGLGIVMETEIWPNLAAICQASDVPLYLVNARLSERSARGYRRVRPLVAATLKAYTGVIAQSEADAARLRELGACAVTVVGNLKFDVAAHADSARQADALRALIGARKVWLAASTREGEEALMIEAWRHLGRRDVLLLIVPRHPQRFEDVACLLREADPGLVRRSENRTVPAECGLMLGDSMGEMAAYYTLCDIAFIGGSLLPLGGQNLIEAAQAGKPVLIGPYTWNFREAAEEAVAAGAARRVETPAALAAAVRDLLDDASACARMADAGRAFAARHRGATQRTLVALRDGLARISSAL